MQNTDIALWVLVLIAIWFMFFRKQSGYCGACSAAMA